MAKTPYSQYSGPGLDPRSGATSHMPQLKRTHATGAFQVVQWLRICLPMQEKKEMQVRSLGQEDSLEEEMATHSNFLTWTIPGTKGPGVLQSMGSQRVGHDRVTKHTHDATKTSGAK